MQQKNVLRPISPPSAREPAYNGRKGGAGHAEFWELVRAAREKTLQDNLSVSEDMQQRLAGAMQTRILKQLCALLLDPDMPDEQAITRARALCLQAQLFFQEHGI